MKTALKRYYYSSGRYRTLYLLSAVEIIVIIIWSLYTGKGICVDSPSYYGAYHEIMSGRLSEYRTPLYPMIVGITELLFGRTFSVVIVYTFQSVLFLYSIKWMGTILDEIIKNKRVCYWLIAIYALNPGILTLCGYIMTDSLSMTLMSALIYLVYDAYYHNSYKMAALSGLVTLLLWLLRPAQMYIPLIMLVFWICLLLKGKVMRKTALYGLCFSLFSFATLSIYSMMYYKEYRIIGLTSVSTIHKYLNIREGDVIDITQIESPQIREEVDSLLKIHKNNRINAYREVGYLVSKFGIAEVDKFINDQIKHNPKKVLIFLLTYRRQILSADSCAFTGFYLPPTWAIILLNTLYVNNGTVFLISLISLLLLISTDIKAKQISYFLWLLFLLLFVNYLTIWAGAPDSFDRLSAPVYPIIIIISCWLLDQLVTKANPSNHNEGHS